MKSLLTIVFFSIACLANAQNTQFCVKNDTHSSNYQFRIEYTCPDDGKNSTHWTNWYKIDEGPNIGTCIPADDFSCKSGWTARTFEVRTGTSENAADLSIPAEYPSTKLTLIDPLNDNAVGTIVWEFLNSVRIF
jgi:hypothetical protein